MSMEALSFSLSAHLYSDRIIFPSSSNLGLAIESPSKKLKKIEKIKPTFVIHLGAYRGWKAKLAAARSMKSNFETSTDLSLATTIDQNEIPFLIIQIWSI